MLAALFYFLKYNGKTPIDFSGNGALGVFMALHNIHKPWAGGDNVIKQSGMTARSVLPFNGRAACVINVSLWHT